MTLSIVSTRTWLLLLRLNFNQNPTWIRSFLNYLTSRLFAFCCRFLFTSATAFSGLRVNAWFQDVAFCCRSLSISDRHVWLRDVSILVVPCSFLLFAAMWFQVLCVLFSFLIHFWVTTALRLQGVRVLLLFFVHFSPPLRCLANLEHRVLRLSFSTLWRLRTVWFQHTRGLLSLCRHGHCYFFWVFRKSALSSCKLTETENQEHRLQPEVTGFSELPTNFLKNIVFNAKYSQTRSALSTNWWQIDTFEKALYLHVYLFKLKTKNTIYNPK